MQCWDSSLATRQQAAIIYCMLKCGSSWKYFKMSFIKEFVNGCIQVWMLDGRTLFPFLWLEGKDGARERNRWQTHRAVSVQLFNYLLCWFSSSGLQDKRKHHKNNYRSVCVFLIITEMPPQGPIRARSHLYTFMALCNSSMFCWGRETVFKSP